MNRLSGIIATCLFGVVLHAALSAAEPAPVFKVGFVEKDITPEIGSEAPGGYGKAYHKTLHDPCKVRAGVFDDGKNVVAVVGIDALSIHRPTVDKVRKAVSAKTKIPEKAILLNASHSHSSGPMSGVMPGEYDDAPEFIQTLAYKESTCVDPKYLTRVETALIDAVCQAYEGRVDARAGVGKGIEKTVAFNRRFKMRDGRTITHPGQGNPDIVEPASPTDPEVGVIGVWDAKNKMLGCIVNFSCHATTSPGGISANYIYYLEKVIQGFYGKEAVVVFIAGASGDITQVNNLNPFKQPTSEHWAELVGGRIGAEALKVLLNVEPGVLAPVEARTKVVKVKRRVPDPEKTTKALETVKKDKTKSDHTEWTFAKEIALLDAILKKEPTVDVEIQAIQIGPVVLISTPAEYFCQFGLDIKAGSGFPFTFPASLTNGCVGYVPTEDAFDPKTGGGYETRLTSYSNLEITAGRLFADTGIELAKQLKPGVVPMPGKHGPFSQPWTYGNVRPEVK